MKNVQLARKQKEFIYRDVNFFLFSVLKLEINLSAIASLLLLQLHNGVSQNNFS